MSGWDVKTDSHEAGLDAKIELRRRVLAHVSPAHVFDAFCGLGEMRREAWSAAASWTGCDQRPWSPDQPARFIADNLDVMRAIDLSRFNVFDFDAYGSPWGQMLILAKLRRWAPGERGAVLVTDGSGASTQWGRTGATLGAVLGADRYESMRGKRLGANRAAFAPWTAQAGVVMRERWEAARPGRTGVLYTALVFEGQPATTGSAT